MAAANYFDSVQKLYIAFYQRPADSGGLLYWSQRLDAAKGSLEGVVDAFATSAEANTLYGTVDKDTVGTVVDKIYQALFNRTPDEAGKKYYVDGFLAGKFTAGKIALDVLNGATNNDLVAINNKVTVANRFTETVDGRAMTDGDFGVGSVFAATYAGDTDAQAAREILVGVTSSPATMLTASDVTAQVQSKIADQGDAVVSQTSGKTFALTTGADTGVAFTGTAGNDTFVAGVTMAADGVTLVDTLQNIDSLTGGAGTDTLNVTLDRAGATPTLNGVEIVNLRATGVTALDLSAATGVTNVNVANSTAVATLTSIGAAAVGVANQNQNVNINGSTATALSLNLDTVGTAAADITVDLGSATANAATSFAITAKDAHVTFAETTGSAATTSATIAATGANEITFAALDRASLTSVTVSGSGSVDLGAAMTALKTLTAGDGGVKVNATGGVLETVTAGAGKDTVTAVGATVKSISTGAGNDTVNQVTTDLAATATVDLGAGDDSVVFGTKFAAGATVAGGDGTDTIGLAKANYALISAYSAANLAKVTGFEVLSITDALVTGDSIDVSKIAGITSFKAAAGVATGNSAAATNLGAASTVELAGADANDGTLSVSLKTDTAADSMTVKFNKNFVDNNNTTADVNIASQTVVAADIESLTVNSTGTQTDIFTAVDGYKVDTITNTLALNGSNKLTGVTVTGDQKLVLASTALMTKLATVDGSANTGGLNFDGSLADMTTATTSVAMTITGSATAANALIGTGHADTITGGAKADIITGGLGADALNGGTGNDTFVYNAAGESTLVSMDVITGFSANTYGNGASGAAGTGAAADTTKWTGDVLKFDAAAAQVAAGAVVSVQANAADAQTFLQNLAADATPSEFGVALDSSSGKLYIDWNSNGTADSVIQLTGVTTITAAAVQLF